MIATCQPLNKTFFIFFINCSSLCRSNNCSHAGRGEFYRSNNCSPCWKKNRGSESPISPNNY